jgi:hypothetical protein
MSYYQYAYSTRNTVDNTKHYTEYVLRNNIPGAIIECGVAKGAQIGAIQDVLDGMNQTRWVYGFDSFEGIPIASIHDTTQPGIGEKADISYNHPSELLRSTGVTSHSLESVRYNLSQWTSNTGSIVLVKGWFQNTLPLYSNVFEKLKIAMLRLDGDLYESTKVSLISLCPHLSTNGILIVDDWQLPGCRKACEEYFMNVSFCRIKPPFGDESDGPAYFQKVDVPMLKYRKNMYSQNGEDGIISEILNRIPNLSRWVCEFGAWDGKQCSNTFSLVEKRYSAVYIEARDDYYQDLLETVKEYPNIIPIHQMVDYEGSNTLDDILSRTDIPIDFDVLSIDIDSYDYQVWKSVTKYSPKVVIIEINSSVSPLNETHIHGPSVEGTGFLPMMKLGIEKGYTLLCHTGNLIFVRNDLAYLFASDSISPELCHRNNWIFT